MPGQPKDGLGVSKRVLGRSVGLLTSGTLACCSATKVFIPLLGKEWGVEQANRAPTATTPVTTWTTHATLWALRRLVRPFLCGGDVISMGAVRAAVLTGLAHLCPWARDSSA